MRKMDSKFNGLLKIKGQKSEHDAFFNVDGYRITVIPCTQACEKIIYKESFDDEQDTESSEWLYGISTSGHCVAFNKTNKFSASITTPINLGAAVFNAPIILQSASGGNIDLSTFDEIEFRGGIIDYVHIVGRVLDDCITEKCLKFNDKNSYTRSFSVKVNDVVFKVEYTISLDDLSFELGKIPDLRGNIHSVLRFKFSSSQTLDSISTYYGYALKFLQFCTGRLNVNFEVRLYKYTGNTKNIIVTRIIDGFDDYAEESLDIMQVIRFDFLGEKFGDIFELLNDKNTSPHLLFLPKRNKNIYNILYTDVSDICVSLEKEYDLTNNASLNNDTDTIKTLVDDLNKLIDISQCAEGVKNKAKNIVGGYILHMRPSLREKIECLYVEFSTAISNIAAPPKYVEWGIREKYSINDFKKMIKKFIEIRNRASHAGIKWNDGIEIYPHLQLLVYFNVLKRAGYAIEESQNILSYMFSRKF